MVRAHIDPIRCVLARVATDGLELRAKIVATPCELRRVAVARRRRRRVVQLLWRAAVALLRARVRPPPVREAGLVPAAAAVRVRRARPVARWDRVARPANASEHPPFSLKMGRPWAS
eukprot:SAG11_NODE_2530_length_3250_cov_2.524913_3_plen_117_part_00